MKAPEIPACTSALKKLIEKFGHDPVLILKLWGEPALTPTIAAPARSLLGKCQDLFFLLWNTGLSEGTFLSLRLFQGFYSLRHDSEDFLFGRDGRHKEALSSACRLPGTFHIPQK